MIHTTTIQNFEQDINFNVDIQNQLIHTHTINQIKDDLYQYSPDDVVMRDGKSTGYNVIVKRVLNDIQVTSFTHEMIEFYMVVSALNIPIGSAVICHAGSAIKINDDYSVITEPSILFYYDANDNIIDGDEYTMLKADIDMFGNEQKSGTKHGIRYHFRESQYDLILNDEKFHIVKKKDVLIADN